MKRIFPPSRDEVLAAWRKQYSEIMVIRGTSSQIVEKGLEALPEDASPDQISQVIGNNSWTHSSCVLCGQLSSDGVLFGKITGFACADCLTKAVKIL